MRGSQNRRAGAFWAVHAAVWPNLPRTRPHALLWDPLKSNALVAALDHRTPSGVERVSDGRCVAKIPTHHRAIAKHDELVGDARWVVDAKLGEELFDGPLEPSPVTLDDASDRVIGVGILRRSIDKRTSPGTGRAALLTDPLVEQAQCVGRPARRGGASGRERCTLPCRPPLEVGDDEVVLGWEVPLEGDL